MSQNLIDSIRLCLCEGEREAKSILAVFHGGTPDPEVRSRFIINGELRHETTKIVEAIEANIPVAMTHDGHPVFVGNIYAKLDFSIILRSETKIELPAPSYVFVRKIDPMFQYVYDSYGQKHACSALFSSSGAAASSAQKMFHDAMTRAFLGQKPFWRVNFTCEKLQLINEDAIIRAYVFAPNSIATAIKELEICTGAYIEDIILHSKTKLETP